MGRGLMIALGASLALNFFGAGYILSHGLHRNGPPPAAASPRGLDGSGGIARAARYLPDESRDSFRREIRMGLPDMRTQFGEMRQQREELQALMAAEDFDAAAVEAKLEEMRRARSVQHKSFDEAFVRALAAISAEDRQLLIDKAQERRRKRGGRHHGDDRGDDRRHSDDG